MVKKRTGGFEVAHAVLALIRLLLCAGPWHHDDLDFVRSEPCRLPGTGLHEFRSYLGNHLEAFPDRHAAQNIAFHKAHRIGGKTEAPCLPRYVIFPCCLHDALVEEIDLLLSEPVSLVLYLVGLHSRVGEKCLDVYVAVFFTEELYVRGDDPAVVKPVGWTDCDIFS